MAELEKLLITDTLKDWRDKINAILDRIGYAVSTWPNGNVVFGKENNTIDFTVEVPAYFKDIVQIGDSIIINPSTGTIDAISSSAIKLETARNINGTSFDGTRDITTAIWGTSRNFTITDGTNVSVSVPVNGSSNIELKLPSKLNISVSGNADSASKLSSKYTINGTVFDGSKNVTTSTWGNARYVTITDSAKKYTGEKVTVNGASDFTLFLPSTITATLVGNASTATKANSLITPRKINNVDFDGTKDITVQDSTKFPLTGGTVQGNIHATGNISCTQLNSVQSIELSYTSPYIDFHYNNSALDYTSRIIESSSGTLTINSVNINSGNINTYGTITGSRVYNAVFNDYAEFFERAEDTEPGDIIALDVSSDKEVYVKATDKSVCVVGVHSDTYAHIIGGNAENEQDNLDRFIPVGLAGRVYVKILGKAKKGQKVVPSHIPGVGRVWKRGDTNDKIIGYLLESSEDENIKKLKMKIV